MRCYAEQGSSEEAEYECCDCYAIDLFETDFGHHFISYELVLEPIRATV
jgi:hypothetical protein